MITWRAGCGGSRTSGSEGGPGKPTSRKVDRAPRPDPYTEHHTREGKVYCAAVLDAYSRRIVGWSIDSWPSAALVTNALFMAIDSRAGAGVEAGTVIHSDHGVQFASWAFTKRAKDSGLVPSMGSIGDCYDNSMIESFWSRMQVELLNRQRWTTRIELANAIFDYIEIWHNRPTAANMAYSAAPPCPTWLRPGRWTWSSVSSGRQRRTGCGVSTPPTSRPGRGWRSPHSSRTCTRVGSWAGARRTGCPPSCRWTPWRWPLTLWVRAGRQRGHPSLGRRVARADSTGRRNTSSWRCQVGRAVGWSVAVAVAVAVAVTGRPSVRSPGRPGAARRDVLSVFWDAVGKGSSTEDAAAVAGVSPAVGARWFRQCGSMRNVPHSPASGRYLSFAEREEIALLRAQGHGGASDCPLPRAIAGDDLAGATQETPAPAAGRWCTGPAPPTGMPNAERRDPRRRSWPTATGFAATSRTVSLAW